MSDLDYCTHYHCPGDCGHPHNQRERIEMAECLTPAKCSDEEFAMARKAGLLVVSVDDEIAIHRFAELVRLEGMPVIDALKACVDVMARMYGPQQASAPGLVAARAAIEAATGAKA